MWHRVVCSAVVLLACNGASKREDETAAPTVAPVQQTMAVDAMAMAMAMPVPGHAGDTWAHAKPVADGEYATRIDRYRAAYLDLLWVDLTLAEMLAAFPGAPSTNRYSSYTFEWKLPDREKLEKALARAKAAATFAIEENGETDRAVLAYTTQALLVWPEISALAEYYKGQRYVDDEFARGREKAPLVAEAIGALAPLRTPMTDGVFSGWREAAGDTEDSPRAIIGEAFQACMTVAKLIFDRPKGSGKRVEAAEAVIDTAMGACRRGVGAVSGLPEIYRSFDRPLRDAAIAFGNAVDSNFSRQYAVNDVERLVTAYIERWPKLPSEPAEKPEKK